MGLAELALVVVVAGAVIGAASVAATVWAVVDLVRFPDPRWLAGLVLAMLTWPIGVWTWVALRSATGPRHRPPPQPGPVQPA